MVARRRRTRREVECTGFPPRRQGALPPERILFVDDMLTNVAGAQREGLMATQYQGIPQLIDFLNVTGAI